MSILTTKTEKDSFNEKVIYFEPLELKDLPNAMKKMGWNTAHDLMVHWFDSPKFSMSLNDKNEYLSKKSVLLPEHIVNKDIVKMNWAKKFKRVVTAINELKLTWNTPKANKRLFLELARNNPTNNQKMTNLLSIGYTNDVIALDSYAQVNFKTIGNISDTLDDFYGAIGKGNLKVCLQVFFDLQRKPRAFHLEKIGFYLKDCYDFAKEYEFLGFWTKDGILSKAETLAYAISSDRMEWSYLTMEYQQAIVPVYNHDFRRWRNEHNKGGDFIVFSDVYWEDCPMIITEITG